MNKSLLVVMSLFIVAINPLYAIPLGWTKIENIRGTIVDWQWRGKINYEQWDSNGNGKRDPIPSHYIIRIKIEEKRDANKDKINHFSEFIPIKRPILHNENGDSELADNEIELFLPSPRLEGMKKGATIFIGEYKIFAADTGMNATYSKILINDIIPKQLKPIFFEESGDTK